MIKISINRLADLIGSLSQEQSIIEGVAVDSRLVEPGNAFFALEGENTDGHLFIGDAVQKGASVIIAKQTYAGCDFGVPLIRVESVLDALQQFTKKILEEKKVQIIAVTGSVGKTTTKDFIAQLLRQRYSVLSTEGNSNSQIGLPLTILNQMEGNESWLVLEMGMTLPGQIAKLVSIAPPKIALITSVALVHAVNFSSLREIAHAKGEIFRHSKTEWGICPYDLPFADELRKLGTCRKRSYSVAFKGADDFLEERANGHLRIRTMGGIFHIENFSIPGKHNRHNYLAAVVAARLTGLEWDEIQEGTKRIKLPERRLQFQEHHGILFINDSYNASPVSVKAALESLPPSPGGRRIAVLGDMLELGNFSESCHRDIGKAAAEFADLLFCLGAESRFAFEAWKQSKDGAYWFSQQKDLVEALRTCLRQGDVVLVKGSRGMQMWKVIEDLVMR